MKSFAGQPGHRRTLQSHDRHRRALEGRGPRRRLVHGPHARRQAGRAGHPALPVRPRDRAHRGQPQRALPAARQAQGTDGHPVRRRTDLRQQRHQLLRRHQGRAPAFPVRRRRDGQQHVHPAARRRGAGQAGGQLRRHRQHGKRSAGAPVVLRLLARRGPRPTRSSMPARGWSRTSSSPSRRGPATRGNSRVTVSRHPRGTPITDETYRWSHAIIQTGTASLDFPRRNINPKVHYVGALLPHRAPEPTAARPPTAAAASPAADARQPTAAPGTYRRTVVVTQGTVDNRDPAKLMIPTIEALKDTDSLHRRGDRRREHRRTATAVSAAQRRRRGLRRLRPGLPLHGRFRHQRRLRRGAAEPVPRRSRSSRRASTRARATSTPGWHTPASGST